MGNLSTDTLRGLKWSYGSTIANATAQIILTAILARLLVPNDFGLMAVSLVIVRFGSYFAEMGVGAALVQKQEISESDINAGYTTTLLFGCISAVLVFLLAPSAQFLFHDKDLVDIVRAMSFSLLVTAVAVPATSLLRRNLRFRQLGIAEVVSYVGSGIVGVSMAIMGFGVWSLVLSIITQNCILAILVFRFSGVSAAVRFDLAPIRKLFSYGGRFSLISFLEFLTYNIDTVLIGSLLGTTLAGTYNRASVLVNLPAQYLNRSLLKVLFPSFSRLQGNIARMRDAYLSGLLFLGIGLFGICFGISAASHEIVVVVLGNQWTDAIPVLTVLALAIPFHLLLHFSGIVFDATGRLDSKLFIRLVHATTLVGAYIFYGSRYGLQGFATVLLVGETVFYALYTLSAARLLRLHWRNAFRVHFYVLSAGVIVGLPVQTVGILLRKTQVFAPAGILAAESVTGLLALALYVLFFPPKHIRSEVARRFFYDGSPFFRSAYIRSFASWYTAGLI